MPNQELFEWDRGVEVDKQAVITVYCNGEQTGFVYPFLKHPYSYEHVGEVILKSGLRVPNGDATISLLHAAYCSSNYRNRIVFKVIRDNFQRKYFWIYSNIRRGIKGVYIQDDEEAKGSLWLGAHSRNELMNMAQVDRELKDGKLVRNVLFSKDNRSRFVRNALLRNALYESQGEIMQDDLLLGLFGEQGTLKLSEIMKELKRPLKVVKESDRYRKQTIQSVPAIGCFDRHKKDPITLWTVLPAWDWGATDMGYALGMQKEYLMYHFR